MKTCRPAFMALARRVLSILTVAALTLTGAGIVVVRAEQTGNDQFNPASVEASASVVATEEPPVVLLPPGKDGMLMLEVLAPAGKELIVETTTDLRTWAEVTRVTGLGIGAPVKVPLTPAPGEPTPIIDEIIPVKNPKNIGGIILM